MRKQKEIKNKNLFINLINKIFKKTVMLNNIFEFKSYIFCK